MILAVRHVDIEDAGLLSDIFGKMGEEIKYIDVWRGYVANDNLIHGSKLLIILGGYMGVYEAEIYPFMKETFRLAERFLRDGKPVLGICLGAQVIAHVLGAKVYKGHRKEIGWFDVFKVSGHHLINDFPDKLEVFHWHGDTFDIPRGAQRIFSSELYENQGFIMGRAVALQFHIEVSPQMIETWCDSYKDELEQEGIPTHKLLRYNPKLPEIAQAFAQRLLS